MTTPQSRRWRASSPYTEETLMRSFFMLLRKLRIVLQPLQQSLWRCVKIPVKIIGAVRQLRKQSKQGGTFTIGINDSNGLSHTNRKGNIILYLHPAQKCCRKRQVPQPRKVHFPVFSPFSEIIKTYLDTKGQSYVCGKKKDVFPEESGLLSGKTTKGERRL